jgi:ribonuclease T1
MKDTLRAARAVAVAFALAVAASSAPAWAQKAPPPAIGEIAATQLPAEARATLTLIREGGPYPYAKDGAIFGNREGILPKAKHGYYREYTVKTPGERTRGARRIIVGRGGEFFYTDDHYNHFSRIRE